MMWIRRPGQFVAGLRLAGGLLLCALWAGCGTEKAPPEEQRPPAPAQPAPADADADAEPGENGATQDPFLVRFDDAGAGGGVDPFFPMSSRMRVAEQSVAAEESEARLDAAGDLELKGIFGSRAFINDRLFSEGEEGTVRVGKSGRAFIKCIEIRANSVLVELENVGQQELVLRGRGEKRSP